MSFFLRRRSSSFSIFLSHYLPVISFIEIFILWFMFAFLSSFSLFLVMMYEEKQELNSSVACRLFFNLHTGILENFFFYENKLSPTEDILESFRSTFIHV